MNIYRKEYDEKAMMDKWASEHAEGRTWAVGILGESPTDACYRSPDLKKHCELSDDSGVIAVSYGDVLVIRLGSYVSHPMAADVTDCFSDEQ